MDSGGSAVRFWACQRLLMMVLVWEGPEDRPGRTARTTPSFCAMVQGAGHFAAVLPAGLGFLQPECSLVMVLVREGPVGGYPRTRKTSLLVRSTLASVPIDVLVREGPETRPRRTAWTEGFLCNGTGDRSFGGSLTGGSSLFAARAFNAGGSGAQGTLGASTALAVDGKLKR